MYLPPPPPPPPHTHTHTHVQICTLTVGLETCWEDHHTSETVWTTIWYETLLLLPPLIPNPLLLLPLLPPPSSSLPSPNPLRLPSHPHLLRSCLKYSSLQLMYIHICDPSFTDHTLYVPFPYLLIAPLTFY